MTDHNTYTHDFSASDGNDNPLVALLAGLPPQDIDAIAPFFAALAQETTEERCEDGTTSRERYALALYHALPERLQTVIDQALDIVNSKTKSANHSEPHDPRKYWSNNPVHPIATAMPIDLLPEFRALDWRAQTLLRAERWLLPAGGAVGRVGDWLLNTLEANPAIDADMLQAYWREWFCPPFSRKAEQPFHGRNEGRAWYAYKFAVGKLKAHRRRKLTAEERQRCASVITFDEPANTDADDMLTAFEREVIQITQAAWESTTHSTPDW